jgi:hypothetical protein
LKREEKERCRGEKDKERCRGEKDKETEEEGIITY